ncbi:unnamed protein product [Vicia faba]|nr:unnamed protein product [Vicia faba]
MSEEVGVLIGDHRDKFVCYDDHNNFAAWRKYMRIKVATNVQHPLEKNWAFDRVEGEKVQLTFKFEKRGTFYFLCGIIGHWRISVRGNNGANRWLRNGRTNEGVSRKDGEGTINNQLNEETSSKASEIITRHAHLLYGRVAIERDPASKKVFLKLTTKKSASSNSWIAFSPTDRGNAPTTVSAKENANGTGQNVITDLAVSLANKMVVRNLGTKTGGAEHSSTLSPKMQLVINDIATPPIFKIQEPTRELPPGTFKVFDNKMFKPICEANNPTAVNFLSLTDG